jgi:hypothetical protein
MAEQTSNNRQPQASAGTKACICVSQIVEPVFHLLGAVLHMDPVEIGGVILFPSFVQALPFLQFRVAWHSLMVLPFKFILEVCPNCTI